ncbi:hypothetical protein [Pseudoduganella sp. GCM10020061]|uniref:hypothetical protein n=1 Tax=Pseudoduganella sp. GCM10020061 TaxID=3317345 RepID=UPI003629C5D9
MSKFELHIVPVVVLVTASYSATVAAQVYQPNSLSSRPHASREVSSGDRSEPGTASVKRRISSDEAPALTGAIRVNPIEMVPLRGRPYVATSGEGRIHYFYENDRLVQEQIGDRDDETIVGDYVYDEHGRLDRIEYDDGIIISAKYGSYGQLDSLASNQGRTIGFGYCANQNGAIRAVTPTQNFLEFHSGVALLRLKYRPAWWPALMDRTEKN